MQSNTNPTKPATFHLPLECGVPMPFGRHAGECLSDIYHSDRPYLKWVAEEISDDDLREAASVVLQYMDRRRA